VKKQPLLLGITGAFGSGKSTASAFFAAKGFTHIRLSSYLEAEIKTQKESEITRKLLQDKGNELRTRFGAGYLAKKALEQIEKEKLDRVIIDGIRNMEEVEVLCTNPNFLLLAVVTDRDVRLKRLQAKPRREPLTMQTFAQLDYRDLGVGEKDTGLQTGMCIALADVYVDNNGTEAAFTKKLEKYLEEEVN
jgi:dephospho-CoA kinase